jgi:hypothetical protein
MIIFWERAKKPVTLTAGNFVTLSLTTLTGVSNKQIKRVVYTANIFVSFHMQDLGKHLLNIKYNLKNLQKLNTDNLSLFFRYYDHHIHISLFCNVCTKILKV